MFVTLVHLVLVGCCRNGVRLVPLRPKPRPPRPPALEEDMSYDELRRMWY